MNRSTLQPFIEKLTKQLDLEKIYFFYGTLNQKKYNRLLLLLSPQCQQSPKELVPVAQVILEKAECSFILLKSPDIRNALLNEHPFFISVCTPEHLVFTNGKNTFPLLEPKAIELAKSAAQTKYANGMEKALSFVEGVHFYKEKGDYPLAAFMLHQTIELSYKALAQSLFKKDKHSHHIKTHINTVTSFIPELENVFPGDNEAEINLLQTLDQAYLAVRYKNYFQISEKVIETLLDRVDQLQKLSEDVFENYIGKLDQLKKERLAQESHTNTPIQTKSPAAHRSDSGIPQLDGVIKRVLDNYNVEYIYLLFENYTKQSTQSCLLNSSTKEENHICYLLVISDKDNTRELDLLIDDRITVYILLHEHKSVTKALASGNRFFLTALNTAPLLYKRKEIMLHDIPSFDWQKIYTKARTKWEYRLQLAKAFLKAAEASHHEICQTQGVALSLLSRFAEQICLGLLQVFLGYKPNTANLRSLFTLSRLCTAELSNILHTHTENSRHLIKLLSNSLTNIRFQEDFYVDFDDVEELIYRCGQILRCFELLCQEELNVLKAHGDRALQH